MNTYEEVLDWLFVQIPNYQRQGGPAYKPGLDNIEKLLGKLNNPQELFPSIHIAGTNGKGSVSHMLSAIYQANGYKTGVFTSPHIADFRERIKINGEMISKEFVLDFVNDNQLIFKEVGATFFEICTAMAFQAFKEENVDIAIVETGMGGRLDSTNVLNPELSIITNIGLDHTKYLGETLEAVAGEKAGIIKLNIPVLIGRYQKEVDHVFKQKAAEKNAEIYHADKIDLHTDLHGKFQKENANTAYKAVRILDKRFRIDLDKVKLGLSHVATLTNFIGRFQLLDTDPLIIADAAHNPAGVQNLLTELAHLEYENLHIILGLSNDKDVTGIFEKLPKKALYYLTEFDSARTTKQSELENLGVAFDLEFTICKNPIHAMRSAKTLATKHDLILVFGSFFILQSIIEANQA